MNNVNELYTEAGYISYEWYFNDTLIAETGDQLIIAEKSGIYRVQVTDEFGCSGTSADFEHIVINTESKSTESIRIYPNPNEDNLVYIQLNDPSISSARIRIIDQSGRIVLEQVYKDLKAMQIIQMDISGLAKGNYYIQINNDEASMKLPFIKI